MKNNKIHYIAKSTTTPVDETLQNEHAHPKKDRFFIPLKTSLAQINGKNKTKSYLDNIILTI